jgi:hypothetical protein
VDPRIRLAIEIAAECRTGQVLRCTRSMLTLSEAEPAADDVLPVGALGRIIIPGAGKKHGEVVIFAPKQRRTVDDALAGYLANYEAAYRAGELADYALFPGSRMRMLDDTGRRWTRRLRGDVKPMSRDGARAAFQALEAIAGAEHVPGRGWYGLRRIAADMAESATTDDRVKDRLGGWQDSETRKHIYQDRETDELRGQAGNVRRQIRLGVGLLSPATSAPASSTPAEPSSNALDLDAILAGLTPEQRVLLAARLDGTPGSAPTTLVGPSVGPNAKSPGPTRDPAIGSAGLTRTLRERATGLKPATSSLGSRAKLTGWLRKSLSFNGERPAWFSPRQRFGAYSGRNGPQRSPRVRCRDAGRSLKNFAGGEQYKTAEKGIEPRRRGFSDRPCE